MEDRGTAAPQQPLLTDLDVRLIIDDARKGDHPIEFVLHDGVPPEVADRLCTMHGGSIRIDGVGLKTLQRIRRGEQGVLNEYNRKFTVTILTTYATALVAVIRPYVEYVRIAPQK